MSTHIRYFTGGLVAIPVEVGGYILGPVSFSDERLGYLSPLRFEEVCRLAHLAGCYYVGWNEITLPRPERSEVWYPNIGDIDALEHSGDSWAGVAFQAHEAGDNQTKNVARHISISMSSASRRLKDVALLLNEQLRWALIRQRASGERYSNVAIHDLYLAIHSLLAEMCSARDYLCQLAAKRVGTKESIDNLSRLQGWLSKKTNVEARDDPLILLLQGAAGSESSPGWLTKLSDLRNQITHRQPLGANPEAAALLYQQFATNRHAIPMVRLARFKMGQEVDDGEDPFVTLLRYWLELEKLSQESLKWAPYGAMHPHFSLSNDQK